MADETFDIGTEGGATGLISSARAQRSAVLADADATHLTNLIDAATAAIQAYCNRTFASDSYTETRDGDGTDELVLDEFPVTALTTCTITDNDGTEYDIDTDSFRINESSGIIKFKPDADDDYTYFPEGFQNVQIVYTAGYDEIPEDIQQACLMLCVHWHGDEDSDPTKQQERLGDYSYMRFKSGEGLPPQVKVLVNKYRDLRV